jgi:F-type H+-transporting ATPase subunit a
MLEISIAAEKIGSVGGFWITNSLLATWVVMAILFIISLLATRNMTMVPSGLQSMMELIVGGFHDFYEQIVGSRIKQFFPLVMSFFLFIIVANWFGLLPGVGTVGFSRQGTPEAGTAKTQAVESAKGISEAGESAKEATLPKTETKFTPLLRGATADINMTLALALIAVAAIQYFGFSMSGIFYAQRFINLTNPINFFLGVLEIISETSKIISFAFRLFGNIFAGEVLLSVMAFLLPFIAPLPFLGLELFVGFIQALVFSMLVSVFMSIAVSEGEHLAHAHAHRHEK